MLNKQVAVAIASGVGLAFLGYCVYFDRKRRSDPDFKRKLRESMICFVCKTKILL
jgi:mitochondrial import receptor subunit TOM20